VVFAQIIPVNLIACKRQQSSLIPLDYGIRVLLPLTACCFAENSRFLLIKQPEHQFFCCIVGCESENYDGAYDEAKGLTSAVMFWVPMFDWLQTDGQFLLPVLSFLVTVVAEVLAHFEFINLVLAIVGYFHQVEAQQAHHFKAPIQNLNQSLLVTFTANARLFQDTW